MTDTASKCEKCGSENLLFSKKRQLYICEDCGHEFPAAHKRRIFLGYGHDEHAYIARRLWEDLRAAGYDIWFDIDKLVGGTDWEKFIEDGMEWVSEYPGEGRHILLMTPYSVRRPDGFCLNEISRAIRRGIPLIPVMVVTSDIPAPIRGLPWLDMRDCLPPGEKADVYRGKLEALIRVIERTAREGDLMAPMLSAPVAAPDPGKLAVSGPLRIFISCAQEHRALAVRLKEDLGREGFQVCYSPTRDRSDSDYELAVEDGLSWTAEAQGSGRFLLIMGPASVRRPGGACLNELSHAIAKKLTVVPVMASLCEPPLSISRLQWLDMRDCLPLDVREIRYQARLLQLIDTLRTGQMDVEGVQSRLMRVLDPVPCDADIQGHVAQFVGRRAVIADICAWLKDTGASRTLWLTGPPGSGKSAIAAWFAYNRPEVLAVHFCNAGSAQRWDPGKFVQSIAYQLATQLPELQPHYSSMPLEDMVRNLGPGELFDRLIVDPLREHIAGSGGHTALIVVDGIDEAAAPEGIPELLAARFADTPAWLRLLVVGRDSPRLAPAIARLSPRMVDLAGFDSTPDIVAYLRGRIVRHIGPGPALEEAIGHIAADSKGNMLYAVCAADEAILSGVSTESLHAFPRNLGAVYLRFFRAQFPDLERYKARIRPALEVLCASGRSVAVHEMADVLGQGEAEAAETCTALHGLFPVCEGMISPFHPSLVQWLIVRERSAQYFVSASKGRDRLQAMKPELRAAGPHG